MVIMYLLVCFVLFVFVAVLSFVHISQVIGSVTDCCSYTSRRVSVLSDDGGATRSVCPVTPRLGRLSK